MKTNNLRNIRCIKRKGNRVLVRDDEINKRWKNYFHNLYNENPVRGVRLDDTSLNRDIGYVESRSRT